MDTISKQIVYLLLGSNRGEREHFIKRAIHQIELEIGSVSKRSSLYQTQPWGFNDNTDFLNQVVVVLTSILPEQIMLKIHLIEQSLGRVRVGEGYSERTIDIDILFYGDMVINSDILTIPHPRITERRFVLEPMKELAPDLVHPILLQPIKDLLAACNDNSYVKKL